MGDMGKGSSPGSGREVPLSQKATKMAPRGEGVKGRQGRPATRPPTRTVSHPGPKNRASTHLGIGLEHFEQHGQLRLREPETGDKGRAVGPEGAVQGRLVAPRGTATLAGHPKP